MASIEARRLLKAARQRKQDAETCNTTTMNSAFSPNNPYVKGTSENVVTDTSPESTDISIASKVNTKGRESQNMVTEPKAITESSPKSIDISIASKTNTKGGEPQNMQIESKTITETSPESIDISIALKTITKGGEPQNMEIEPKAITKGTVKPIPDTLISEAPSNELDFGSTFNSPQEEHPTGYDTPEPGNQH
ncbi:24328_t:CDS:2 [Dentiscutata erythropus]|uniref:24328_t:CDS:1 n=1 Tax=Dentiscutata erythropus TaxID=1348616 RepID=A0A9N8W5D4_9GLOM|nr:24328_t:CDS:2 [Dentiscutata erythropus]